MDVIAKIAFGLNIDSQKDKNNIFVRMAKQGLQLGVFNPFMFITCTMKWTSTRLLSFPVSATLRLLAYLSNWILIHFVNISNNSIVIQIIFTTRQRYGNFD